MKTVRFFFGLIWHYRWHYFAGLAVIPFSTYFILQIPYLTGKAIDFIDDFPEDFGPLYSMGQAMLLFAAGRGVCLFLARYFLTGASRHIEYELRDRLFRHLQSLDLSFYSSARTGDLMSRATADVEAVRSVAGPAVMYSVSTLFMLTMALERMASVHLGLTITVMLPLLLLPIAVRLVGPRVQTAFRKSQETLAEISTFAQENSGGIRVVKSFAFEDRQTQDFQKLCDRYYDENLRLEKISNWMPPIVGALKHVTIILLMVAGGLVLFGTTQTGNSASNFGIDEFIQFVGYLGLLIWPMISIGWVVNQIYRGIASVGRLQEILTQESSVIVSSLTDQSNDSSIVSGSGEIEIRDLNFSYDSHPVLEHVNMKIPAGKTVALIGRTGCGKSTLAGLIPRQYPVPDGSIFIDGRDVNSLPLGALRRIIGFVPQETFLFSRTLAQNIAFGISGDEDGNWLDEVDNYARVARLDKDIDQFTGGLNEIVGERGVTLSGGQKQRVAISRALLYKPRVLILDDALSAVDTHTEEEILTNLREVTRGLTVLLISHRISSIKDADRIYVLDEGRIVEEGGHDELRRRGGLYEELYQLQLLEEELEDM